MAITDKQVSQIPAGEWLSESLGKGNGTLLARRTGDGIQFYYRYTLPEGKRDTLRIGTYDRNEKEGRLTLRAARSEALRLSGLYRQHPHLREWLDEEAHLAAEALRREKFEREHASLAALLNGYVAMLEQQGKSSAKNVKGCLKLHVIDAWPRLAEVKASSISRRELTLVISRLVEAGKGREAAKLRSYIRAAFAAALRADGDPTVPPALRGFNIEVNPASDLASLSQFNVARDTNLSLPELRTLWRKMQTLNGVIGSALRLCLLLGGQRPAQLVRIKSTDVDLYARTVTLYDPKGNRPQPRRHVVPLTERAAEELLAWLRQHEGAYLFSSTQGNSPVCPESLTKTFASLVKGMVANGELSQKIRLADIRRTVETVLAGENIAEIVRAHLQSHGLGGVQKRHYDRHHYMPEKRNALEVLDKLLTGEEDSNIFPFQQASA